MEQSVKPRNAILAYIIAIIFGPISVFLWFGRGRYALATVFVFLGIMGAMYCYYRYDFGYSIYGSPKSDVLLIITQLTLFLAAVISIILYHKYRNLMPKQKWYTKNIVVSVIVALLLPLLIAFIIRTLLYQPYQAPSSSMAPSLILGDHFAVDKFIYGYSKYSFPFAIVPIKNRIMEKEPKRGDIVVFKLPSNPTVDYVKRIVGLPGDKLFLENGVSYIVFDSLKNGDGDNIDAFIIPAGQYFMLGDNRDNSLDSRYIGFVPFENLVGKVKYLYWNTEDVPYSNRIDGYQSKK